MAVIQMKAEWIGIELVDERPAGLHFLTRQRSIDGGRMPAVEVDRVGV